ncbi:MAG: class I SAM-dependent methyltransferase [Pseudomonadota bacterium]
MKRRPIEYVRAIRKRLFEPNPWPLTAGRPWMCDPAVQQLDKLVFPGARILEWGSGGSSIFFAERGADVICVEHDRSWARLVRSELGRRGLSERVTIKQIDLTANYVGIVDGLDGRFDLVVVDGRRRVECVHKARNRVVAGGWLVLDDSDRQAYSPAVEQMAGWHTLVLKGPRPQTKDDPQTTFWQRPAHGEDAVA